MIFLILTGCQKEMKFQTLQERNFLVAYPMLDQEEKKFLIDHHFSFRLKNSDCTLLIFSRTDDPIAKFLSGMNSDPRNSIIETKMTDQEADFLYDFYDNEKYFIIHAVHTFCNNRYNSVVASCTYQGSKKYGAVLQQMFNSIQCQK